MLRGVTSWELYECRAVLPDISKFKHFYNQPEVTEGISATKSYPTLFINVINLNVLLQSQQSAANFENLESKLATLHLRKWQH